MNEKTNKNEELMLSSLQCTKAGTEMLRCAIHAVLLIDNAWTVGYFGITDNYLVVALPDLSGKRIIMKADMLLDGITAVETKRTMFTHQLIITLKFNDGKVYRIRAAEKVHDMPGQAEQLRIFTEILTSLTDD